MITRIKFALTALTIALVNAPSTSAAAAASPNIPKFATASITPCQAFSRRPVPDLPGRLQTGCTNLAHLIEQAYGLFANGHMNVLSIAKVDGGPTWLKSDLYKIEATAPGQTQAMMHGPMLQALLEDRFQLKVHRETEVVPVYVLTASKSALKTLEPFKGTCFIMDSEPPPNHAESDVMCGTTSHLTNSGFDLNAATIADLCLFLDVTLDRPVIDKTTITGRFVFHLAVPTETLRHQTRGISAYSNPNIPPPPPDPAFLAAAKSAVKKLGLGLEPTNGPRELIVIDSVARP